MLHVTIERDGKPPETRDLAGPTLVVGRDEGLELKLQHEDGASRRHCQISAEGGALHVEDLGSSNGTKVNGKKIDRRVALKPGDVVGVGKVRLRVTIEAGAPAKQSAVKVAAVAGAPAKQSAVKVAAVAEAPVRKPVEAARKPVEAAVATRRPAAEAPKASAAPAARVIVKSGADVEAEAEPEPAPVARDPAQPRDPAVHDENEACRGELDPLARRWRELGRPAAGLLFGAQQSNSTVARKRQELGPLFAVLGGQHAEATLNRPANDRIKAFAHFVVGGVGQTIGGWLAGDVGLSADDLIDQLAAIVDVLTDPRRFRD